MIRKGNAGSNTAADHIAVLKAAFSQLPGHKPGHRRRARWEDRIRIAKDTGLRNLPLHDFDQNRIWLALIALAVEITAWMQMLALGDHAARRWEPKRLRLRFFSVAAWIADHGRTRRPHLSAHAPWVQLLADAIDRLKLIPAPI